VEKFTALGLTLSSIAEIGTLEGVTGRAMHSLVAIPEDSERTTNRSSSGNIGMSIPAVRVGTVSFDEMQAGRCSLRSEVMREVARLSVSTGSLEQKIFANGDPLGVMLVPTSRAFGAGT
jgi:hypothetical protein